MAFGREFGCIYSYGVDGYGTSTTLTRVLNLRHAHRIKILTPDRYGVGREFLKA